MKTLRLGVLFVTFPVWFPITIIVVVVSCIVGGIWELVTATDEEIVAWLDKEEEGR